MPAQTQKQMTETFGDYIKRKRLGLGLTLRKFCGMKGYDTAYWSRLENNILPAPKSKDKLTGIAVALGIDEGTASWVDMFDLAATSNYELPIDIKNKFLEVSKFLPAFYRTLRNNKLSESDIENILKSLKGDIE